MIQSYQNLFFLIGFLSFTKTDKIAFYKENLILLKVKEICSDF